MIFFVQMLGCCSCDSIRLIEGTDALDENTIFTFCNGVVRDPAYSVTNEVRNESIEECKKIYGISNI